MTECEGMDREQTITALSVLLSSGKDECSELIEELERMGRIYFDDDGVMCCKKLIEITKQKSLASQYGSKGGNPDLKGGVKGRVKGSLKGEG